MLPKKVCISAYTAKKSGKAIGKDKTITRRLPVANPPHVWREVQKRMEKYFSKKQGRMKGEIPG